MTSQIIIAMLLVLATTLAAPAAELFAHGAITLRGGPGDGFTSLSSVPSGTRLEVLWCNAAASWCYVKAGDAQGWSPPDALGLSLPSLAGNTTASSVGSAAAGAATPSRSTAGQAPASSLTSAGAAPGATTDNAAGSGSAAATVLGVGVSISGAHPSVK